MNGPAKPDVRISGLILAAGASRRMGVPKALLEVDGETFLDRMIGLHMGICEPILVVLGSDRDRIEAGSRRLAEASIAVNPEPERGMLSSLQSGLSIVEARADAVLFTPVDLPRLRRESVQAVCAEFRSRSHPVVIPVFEGRRGHPVCIARSLISELLALPVDAKASDVIHAHAARTRFLEVDDPGVVADVDDPEDYRRLRDHGSAA